MTTSSQDQSTKRVVLLTGGAGYVGSVLAKVLASSGFQVIVLDKLFFGNPFLNTPEISVIKKDVRDISESDLVGVTDVIDLAAISNDSAGDLDKQLTLDINFRARERLQKLCVSTGVSRYLLASSSSVYGFQENIVSEESSINPLTIYAEANALAEKSAMDLAKSGTVFSAIRQATVYGASRRMRYDLVVNAIALEAIQGNPIRLLRDGNQWRPLVHVLDSSRAMLMVLNAPDALVDGEIFNVGGEDQNLTILQLAQIICASLGQDLNIEWYGEIETRSYRVTFEKIRNTLGFVPEITVPEAVKEIQSGIKDGSLTPKPQNYTVSWYQKLIEDGSL